MGNQQLRISGPAVPKVLLTDTNRWALAARLAIALTEAGCEVAAICQGPNHALMKTRAVRQIFPYRAFHPIEALRAAIEEFAPDIIVPACDRSVEHLHELYAQADSREQSGKNIKALIEKSLGRPASHLIVSSRYDLLAVAREEGVRVPNTSRVNSIKDLDVWRVRESFPWVIKADGTWGGVGVRVIRSRHEIEASWKELRKMSRLSRALKRLAVNKDKFLLRSWWNQLDRKIVVQSYVEGRPANCTVFAWEGRVLALIAVEVIRSDGATGPASIVRVIESAQMKFAAEKIASRLGLSGFWGLDFMIERDSQAAYLVEMNPRLTPPCHLRLGKGRDLVGAFCAQLTGQALAEYPPVTQSEIIAYQSHSPELIGDTFPNCFHDFPHGDPELARELLIPFPDRTILFRLVQYFSRKSSPDEVFAMPLGTSSANRPECSAVSEGIATNMAPPIEKVRIRPF
jgi:biotin carboxylase